MVCGYSFLVEGLRFGRNPIVYVTPIFNSEITVFAEDPKNKRERDTYFTDQSEIHLFTEVEIADYTCTVGDGREHPQA